MLRTALCIASVSFILALGLSKLFAECNDGCKMINYLNAGDDSSTACLYYSPATCGVGFIVDDGDTDEECNRDYDTYTSYEYTASDCTWVCDYDPDEGSVFEMDSSDENPEITGVQRNQGRCENKSGS